MEKELILTIDVCIGKVYCAENQKSKVTMLEFGGKAYGNYFNGQILGTGVDTQKIGAVGGSPFSARYMLEGKDFTGADCHIFIENNGTAFDNFVPLVVTDSAALSEWESIPLISTIEPVENGVTVKFFKSK